MNRFQLFNTNRPCDVILHWHTEGHLDLSPPYQRGDVWGEVRQRNLIRSIVLGIPIASIIINDRTRDQRWKVLSLAEPFLAVIDGKQRITAVLKFLADGFRVPGEWFGLTPFPVLFSEMPIACQRGFRHHPLAFSEGSLGTLDEEREVFELVNFGGVPQGESDLQPHPAPTEG